RNLLLKWRETGGPRVLAPKRSGFGTTLIERTLDVHGGEGSLLYEAEGVTSRIRLPLPPEESNAIVAVRRASGASGACARAETIGRGRLDSKRVIISEDEPLLSMASESSSMDMGCKL